MRKLIWMLSTASSLMACTQQPENRMLDTPTSGSISIAVDKSLLPIIEAEVEAFEAIYRKAHINVVYVSEAEAVRLLLRDSVRLVVITRNLTPVEAEQLRRQRLTPHEEVVAKESVAWIMNPSACDSTLATNELVALLTDAQSNRRLVFEDPSSGVVRYVRDSILRGKPLASTAYAVESNEQVIDYVAHEKLAIGIIGGAWISDRDDSVTGRFLRSVRVAAVENKGAFYQPFQAYLAQKLYPFTRNVVMCSREPRAGLATGFMSFVASDKGQRVILKSGLLPTTMPVRLVEVRRSLQ